MDSIKVSIIVPIYNVSKYILRCLNTIAIQDYRNLECIIVNDCSVDDSMIIVNDFLDGYDNQMFSFVQINHSVNKGLSEARNTGVRASSGDYIFFLDGDDALYVDSISSLVHQACDYQFPDIVYGRTKGIDSEGRERLVDSPKLRTYYSNTEIFEGYLNNCWTKIACNKLIKRSVFFEKGIFFEPGIFNEDELWSFILSTQINKMVFCDKYTYCYYLADTNSITRSRPSEAKMLSNIVIIEHKTCYLKTVDNPSALAKHIYSLVFSTYYTIVRNNFKRSFRIECKKRLDSVLKTIMVTNSYKMKIPWRWLITYTLF